MKINLSASNVRVEVLGKGNVKIFTYESPAYTTSLDVDALIKESANIAALVMQIKAGFDNASSTPCKPASNAIES